MISKLHSYQSVSLFLNIKIKLFAKYERIVLKKKLTTLEGDFSYFFYLEINPSPLFSLKLN